jgi:hypothetical protein
MRKKLHPTVQGLFFHRRYGLSLKKYRPKKESFSEDEKIPSEKKRCLPQAASEGMVLSVGA